MIELAEEQRRVLNSPQPEVFDPVTRETYVLVPKPVYERLRLFHDEGVRASGELVDRIMAVDDANDPYLSGYQSTVGEQGPS